MELRDVWHQRRRVRHCTDQPFVPGVVERCTTTWPVPITVGYRKPDLAPQDGVSFERAWGGKPDVVHQRDR